MKWLLVAALLLAGSLAAHGQEKTESTRTQRDGDVSLFWVGSASVSTCTRCGRSTTVSYGLNFKVNVYEPNSTALVWSGCIMCLVDVLKKNK